MEGASKPTPMGPNLDFSKAMILSKAIFSKLIPPISVLFHSDSIRPTVFCAIGTSAPALYLFFNGFRLLQRRRLILDTPVSKNSQRNPWVWSNSAGFAIGPHTVVAPVTQRSCYYFRTPGLGMETFRTEAASGFKSPPSA